MEALSLSFIFWFSDSSLIQIAFFAFGGVWNTLENFPSSKVWTLYRMQDLSSSSLEPAWL